MKICLACKRNWTANSPYCPHCSYHSYSSVPSSGADLVPYSEEIQDEPDDEGEALANAIEEQILKQLEENLETYRDKLERSKQHILSLAERCDQLNDGNSFYYMSDTETERIINAAYKMAEEIDSLLSRT